MSDHKGRTFPKIFYLGRKTVQSIVTINFPVKCWQEGPHQDDSQIWLP